MARNLSSGDQARAAVHVQQALSVLHATGRVTLAGKPAIWSGGLSAALVALIVLVSLLIPGVVLVPMIIAGPTNLPFGALAGMVSVAGMLIVALLLLTRALRKQRRFRATEVSPVIIQESGLTLRGVGPIPWDDFGRAGHRMVPAERDSGFVRRAVMELSPSGFANVNQRLPQELRARLSPVIGPVWNRHHRFIYVPAAEGLRQGEVMQVINAGRQMFRGPHA